MGVSLWMKILLEFVDTYVGASYWLYSCRVPIENLR
jgi:hypothetical protein